VLQKADPFTIDQLSGVKASIFHLGPLLNDDMSIEFLQFLAGKGRISLDVQGFLRKVRGHDVCAVDWPEKKQVLQHIHYLKANESEMEVLTGHSDVYKGAMTLFGWGVKEVVITLGSKGSIIYCGGAFYIIPAYQPAFIEDTTGCGDTYMAGYLYQRIKSATIQHAGEFAAAMATLKIESSGPFTGTREDVYSLLDSNEKIPVHF
jgi:sugar/nucleoside kinase (ribokinase family)